MLYPWFKNSWKKINNLRNKLPNVILFYGNYGIGKINFVRYFAKSLLCINFIFKRKICKKKNLCVSCFLFLNNNHPDFFSILPKSINNNGKLVYLNKLLNEIKIDQIRLLIKFVYFSSHFSNLKVILLSDIQSLNIFSANSLLKILEEPPRKTIFLLISNNLQNILPTILSRCLKFLLPKPSYKESLLWLNKYNLKGIKGLFYNSGGFPILALDYFYKNYQKKLKNLFIFLCNPFNNNIINLSKYLLNINIKDLFLIFQRWLYDIFFLKIFNNIYFFLNFKQNLLILSKKVSILKIDILIKKINKKILIHKYFLSSNLFIENFLIEYQFIFI